MIIVSDILMHAKQHKTSLLFPIIITKFYICPGLRDTKEDVEVTPTSSLDIRRIKA